MSKRNGYPGGVPCWVDTIQPDVDAAVRFYAGLFGWRFGDPGPLASEGGGAPAAYFVARLRDREVAGIGAAPPGAPPPPPAWSTHVRVESARARRVELEQPLHPGPRRRRRVLPRRLRLGHAHCPPR